MWRNTYSKEKLIHMTIVAKVFAIKCTQSYYILQCCRVWQIKAQQFARNQWSARHCWNHWTVCWGVKTFAKLLNIKTVKVISVFPFLLFFISLGNWMCCNASRCTTIKGTLTLRWHHQLIINNRWRENAVFIFCTYQTYTRNQASACVCVCFRKFIIFMKCEWHDMKWSH